MAKIMAFFLSIVYFFGSFGIGAKNAPTEITVTDNNGNPVSNVTVYYRKDIGKNGFHYDLLAFDVLGVTDEDGKIEWEDKQYGDTVLYVTDGEFSFSEASSYPVADVKISRFTNDPITIVCSDEFLATLS